MITYVKRDFNKFTRLEVDEIIDFCYNHKDPKYSETYTAFEGKIRHQWGFRPNTHIVLAYDGELLIGCIIISDLSFSAAAKSKSTISELFDLGINYFESCTFASLTVHNDYKGGNIAVTLCQKAEEYAKELNFRHILGFSFRTERGYIFFKHYFGDRMIDTGVRDPFIEWDPSIFVLPNIVKVDLI